MAVKRTGKSTKQATRSPKTKGARSVKKKATRRSLLSAVDMRLMDLAAARYEKVLQKVSQQGLRLREDRKLALEIGQKVLERVRAVQGSFAQAARSRTVLNLDLLNLITRGARSALRKNVEKPQA